MISLTKKAIEVSSFLKAKFNLSSDALFSTFAFMGLAILALSPDIADAAATTPATTDNVALVICNIVEYMQGPIVRGVAAFAVIFLGFSLFLGKITWGTALALGIGVAAVFGAEQIIGVMAGSEEKCTAGDATALNAAGTPTTTP